MFPDRSRMIRNANVVWTILAIGPLAYVQIAAMITSGGQGLVRGPNIVPLLFWGLVCVSAINAGFTVFLQTSKSVWAARASFDPLGRAYMMLATCSVLSNAHSLNGLVLTLLSGSIAYVVGFSIVTWACLFWVRIRFKQSLGRLPS